MSRLNQKHRAGAQDLLQPEPTMKLKAASKPDRRLAVKVRLRALPPHAITKMMRNHLKLPLSKMTN